MSDAENQALAEALFAALEAMDWDYNYLIAQQPDTWLPQSPRPRWD